MSAIGLIIGNGYAKAWCDGRQTRFPAVAAPWSAAGYASVTGGGPTPVVLEGHGAWLVGEEAQTFARGRVVAILDKSRYRDLSFVALARAALQMVAPERIEAIMTGMPAAWFADKAAQEQLRSALAHAAAPWGTPTITIAPEAAGVYYRYVFETGRFDFGRTRGSVGVIDAGYRDVNVALFDQGRYVSSESIPGGAVAALRSIKRLIASTYGLELSEIEVDAAVRNGSVRVGGQLQPFPAGVEIVTSGRYPEVMRLVMHEGVEGGPRLDYFMEQLAPLHALMAPLHEAVEREGELPQFSQETFLLSLLMLGTMPFALAAFSSQLCNVDMLAEQQIERHADRVIATLFSDVPSQ